jgi:hypothetical protein
MSPRAWLRWLVAVRGQPMKNRMWTEDESPRCLVRRTRLWHNAVVAVARPLALAYALFAFVSMCSLT